MIKVYALNTNYEDQIRLEKLTAKEFPEVVFSFVTITENSTVLLKQDFADADIIIINISGKDAHLFHFCKQIKKLKSLQYIPVIFLLEKTENTKFYKSIDKTKCDGLLSKPFNKYELNILLRSMIKIKENDIKKNIEKDLRIEKDRADSIIEGANAGTWDWNITTGEMIINSRWAEILGYNVDDLRPVTIDTWRKMVHSRDLRIAENKINEHFKNRIKYYYAEFRMRHKNGNWVWINSRGKTVEYSSKRKPIRMAGTHIDITHKKSIEKELIKAKQKAVESDRLKSAFLSNMSHEIRTPMNGILGFIDLLKNPEINLDTQNYYIDIVKKSGERLLETINDIIELSKIEAGETPYHSATTDVNELMNYFYVFFKPQAENKGIELKYNNNTTTKKTVIQTDRIKLESILTNLIKNSLKFTSKGSIEFNYRVDHDKLYFYVKDTGKGIPEDKLQAIFERFVQANTKMNRGHEGSGLGLSIAKAYSKILGGDISVKSEVGKGSIFEFFINYEPVNAAQILPSVESNSDILDSDLSDIEIIIAEDEDINFMLIEQFLSKVNVQLIHARDGKEVIEICKTNPNISLILMDIKMPKMDGYTAAKHIRKLRPNMPIIAQTAYALTHEVEMYTEFFDDFITKPINRHELKEKIARFLK